MSASPEYRPVPGLIASVRDRWVRVVLCALVGLGLGFVPALLLPAQYAATTTLQIPSQATDAAPTAIGPADAENIAELAPQLESIAEQFGGGLTGSKVKDHLQVVNRPGTSLLDFTWTDTTAARAERGANLAAQVYVDRATELLDGPDAEGTTTSKGAQPNPGVVLMRADGRSEISGLPSLVYVPMGLLVGLLLGLVLAYLDELLRPRVHARYHLSTDDDRFRGRIARSATPDDVALLFLLPERPLDRVGIAVVGSRAGQLDAFATRAVWLAEHGNVRTVLPADTVTVDGLRNARELDGVFVLVREREVSVAELEAALQRLDVAGVRVLGVVTAAPRAARKAPSWPRQVPSSEEQADDTRREAPRRRSDEQVRSGEGAR